MDGGVLVSGVMFGSIMQEVAWHTEFDIVKGSRIFAELKSKGFNFHLVLWEIWSNEREYAWVRVFIGVWLDSFMALTNHTNYS